MKKFPLADVWNADETAVFYNDMGRMSFSPQDHIGRLVKNTKQRITSLIYVNAEGEVPFRPAVIDYNFPLNSKKETKRDIKKI